ncbi:MAG: hypothetical protein ACREO3_03545 [Arenimonas sp.]
MTDTDLRWRLRQLPREIEPAHDLWPGIEARLQPGSRRATRLAWAGGLALAASLLLAVLGWRLVSVPAPDAPEAPVVVAPRADEHVIALQARVLTLEYRAALAEYESFPVPAAVGPGLEAFDASARDIRSALVLAPDSVRLLQQLQRTYTRRLELTHRAVTS